MGLFLSFLLLILYVFFLLPSLFLSRVKESVAIGRVIPVLSADELHKSKILEASLSLLKKNLVTLKTETSTTTSPIYVLDTVLQKPAGIKIDSLVYETAKGVGSLTLTGRASSRDAVAGYVKVLRGQRFFTKVDFPISNLAAEKDIKFTIHAIGTF